MKTLISFLLFLSGSLLSFADRPPNIVLLFCDDLGYGDLANYGHPSIATPHLDRMASQGMRFTQFYSAAAVCSPSRASLLTGRYPSRHGTINVYFHNQDTGLDLEEITLAEMLAPQGYRSACIGKWHLGHKPRFLPTRQGFDSYYGVPYSNDMQIDPEAPFADDATFGWGWSLKRVRDLSFDGPNKPKRDLVPLMRDEEVIDFPTDQALLTHRYTHEALTFIDANRNQPFFLYLAYTMPHVPLFASEGFKGKSLRGLYGDTVEEIDWSVGQILKRLKALKLDENTLVVFTSDNGPWLSYNQEGGSAGHLRGGKFTLWEGGMRVPAIAWWPGRIQESTTSQAFASTLDIVPTVARLAQAKLPEDRKIDGHDLSKVLFENSASPRNDLAYYRKDELLAYRKGPWKIHFAVQPERGGPPGEPLETPQLYHLEHDPEERYDLASDYPLVIQELTTHAASYRKTK